VKPNILIVDDELEHRQLLEMILVDYELHTAVNGQECLEKALWFCPDLILMDVDMPVMDGYTTCERLKEDAALADIPVIFVTSRDMLEERQRGYDAGGLDYLIKPVLVDDVLLIVKEVLRGDD
jgi:putative two-component system response regulator